MKTLIAYCTESGNTEKLAKVIADSCTSEFEIAKIADIKTTNQYDFIFIGFPFNSFAPTTEAQEFIKGLSESQRVALFATHAIPTDSPMNDKQKTKALDCASHLDVVGFFTCRGELSLPITEILLKSDNAEMQYFGKMRPETIGHPNEEELESLKQFVIDLQNQN
nr:flavodoxin family protein [uncultured Carboxylicivirga sp.]